MHIDEAEAAFLELKHCEIGHCAWGKMPQLLVLDFAGRIPCGAKNHIVERHTHRQKLVHHIEHVFHPSVHAPDVEVSRDGIGKKPLFHCGDRNPPHEASSTMAHIKN